MLDLNTSELKDVVLGTGVEEWGDALDWKEIRGRRGREGDLRPHQGFGIIPQLVKIIQMIFYCQFLEP